MFSSIENKLASALVLDAAISQNDLALNGIAVLSDTDPELLAVFKNTIPQETRTQFIAPRNSIGFKSFSFDNFEYFHSNLKAFQKQPIDSLVDIHWLETINEVGEIYFKSDTIVVLNSIDGFSTKEALYQHQNIASTYREIDILEFNSPNQLHLVFRPLLTAQQFSYYAIIEDHILFAKSEILLKNVISNFQNGATIGNETAYKHTTKVLSDESSLLFINKSNAYKTLITSLFYASTNAANLNDHTYAATQFIQDNDYIHLNTSIRKNVSTAQRNTITEIFNTPLDAEVLMPPQFVSNHRTKQKEVIVQDVNNTLYLISNQGKILWKKRLLGNILGTIQQVDLYKNGRLQLAFATPKRVYILDRNGNEVSPFPLKFNHDITQPLSVFDYDNKRNYRFLVTQGSQLLMYNSKAQLVKGFDYSSNTYPISTTPKHFRIQNKDYIVFAVGNELKILNRKGDVRIKVNEPISFSGNEIHLYKNLFTTTSTDGELVQVNPEGIVSKQNLLLSKNHQITASSKTLVSLSENKFTIKHNNFELDFGHYSEPSIFYINDKIYVSITDLQAHKIYLFDSNAKLQNNFPVYGSSKIYLDNIDTDSNLEFVTVGENNSIILYQKN
ncbi:MAG: ribonuclease HII [Flavobacteriaceae bacterium]|nr:ribonuclease HII [Flavobacteriaceae bacterium]